MKLNVWHAGIVLALCVLCSPAAVTAKNLYLYAEYGQYAQGGVLRFPIVNGVAAQKSDFKYNCEEFMCGGLQLAVAPDGTLYYSNGVVYAFKRGQHAPMRRIIVPFQSSCYGAPGAYGVAVNSDGFLAVGGVAFNSGAAPFSTNTPIAGCEKIYLYGPHAHGQPSPLAAFTVGSDSKFLTWVPSGNLYIVAGGYGVLEYAHPLHNPQMIAQYQPNYYCDPNGAAVDERRTLYVFGFCTDDDEIEVFRPNSPYPVRSIVLPFHDASFLSNINLAVLNGLLYVTDQRSGMIDVFDANGSGPQHPVRKIQLPEPGGGPLAIGP